MCPSFVVPCPAAQTPSRALAAAAPRIYARSTRSGGGGVSCVSCDLLLICWEEEEEVSLFSCVSWTFLNLLSYMTAFHVIALTKKLDRQIDNPNRFHFSLSTCPSVRPRTHACTTSELAKFCLTVRTARPEGAHPRATS